MNSITLFFFTFGCLISAAWCSSNAIGIVLGTSTCRVAAEKSAGNIQVIANDDGCTQVSSVLAVSGPKCEAVFTGERARLMAQLNPESAIVDAKRLIGLTYDQAKKYVAENSMPFQVVCHVDGRPQILVTSQSTTRSFFLEEVAAYLIRGLKESAESALGTTVTEAVITVPSSFSTAQRQSLKEACQKEKLTVLEVVSEMSAAAKGATNDGKISSGNGIIVKLGGGFMEIAIFSISNGNIQMKSQVGANVGGADMDTKLVQYFVDDFERQNGKDKDISSNPLAMNRLKIAVQLAKNILSEDQVASIDIDKLHQGISFSSTLTRMKFEELNVEFFNTIMANVENALSQANIEKTAINHIVLLGGMARIAKVQDMLKQHFKLPTVTVNLDAAVIGAAVIATQPKTSTFRGLDINSLKDVTQLTYGVETDGGIFNVIIPANLPLPIKRSKVFKTTHDNQKEALIKIFEGNHNKTNLNSYVNSIILKDLPKKPRGGVEFEVTFEIGKKNILTVTVTEKSTKKSEKLIVEEALEMKTALMDIEYLLGKPLSEAAITKA